MNTVHWMPKTTDENLRKVAAIRVPVNKVLNLTQFRLGLRGKIDRMIMREDDPVQALSDLVSRLESSGLMDAELPPLPETMEELNKSLLQIVHLIVEENPNLSDLLGMVETSRTTVSDNLTARKIAEGTSLDEFLTSLESLI